MSKPVRIEDAARNELRAVVAWYEDKQPGLGDEFFTEVEHTLDLIERHPGLGASVPRVPAERGTRRLPLRRFPYTVYTEKPKSKSKSLPSLIIAASRDIGFRADSPLILSPEANVNIHISLSRY